MVEPAHPKAPAKHRKQTVPDWVALATYLLAVEADQSWRRHAGSFTRFVRREALARGRQPSTLWRAISAARFYKGLGKHYHGLKLPPLEVLPKTVYPEHLELIEKISRVSPSDVSKSLLSELISGDLQKPALLQRWRVYRDRAKPPTRRGRGALAKVRPTIIASKPLPLFLAQESAALLELEQQAHLWLPDSQSSHLSVFYNLVVELPNAVGRLIGLEYDAVFVVRDKDTSEIYLHGVDVKRTSAAVTADKSTYLEKTRYLDYSWILVLESSPADRKKLALAIPSGVGLLLHSADSLVLQRLPAGKRVQNSRSGILAKHLLALRLGLR